METAEYLRFAFALIFVLGLIAAAALAARRFGLAPGAATSGTRKEKRLEIVETLALDTKRRVIILRRDGKEHLLLLGPDSETIIEQGFDAPARPDTAPAREKVPAEAKTQPEMPTADDDIFGRLRKVAELMQDMRQASGRRNIVRAPMLPQQREDMQRTAAGDRL